MTKRMLVDATHPEEVRVAIVDDQRLIDLDIETATKEQIKGNIYLGKVSRVEPSLQAAFVDFIPGRQGFLSVNDIHPKYFTQEEKSAAGKKTPPDLPASSDEEDPELFAEPLGSDDEFTEEEDTPPPGEVRRQPRRRPPPIQNILHRNQTVLVQVVKEARGNKGASLTTNISLAGRYTVLLPENSGGGGISRKIPEIQERKNLKEILASLNVPPEVSLIIRTAGLNRNKREFSRDMNYLLRLWKNIRAKTLECKAPGLIHEEGDLIIRTIRDLYTTEMDEILIEGPEGYRRGKDFMRLLMPRYVKVVQPYRGSIPLFAKYKVEEQIETMHDRVVQLKAGSYLVIDPTEALVTIDINSGRSTREKDVETTAFKTNLQATDEIARQLRIRDLGGLVVIDFIDMEDKKHILEVEKRIKEAFKEDRAKVQIGRISQFGLLELSRQRMRPTFSETNRQECTRCKGSGTIRSVESTAIHIFRCIEEEISRGNVGRITCNTSPEVANYLFNHKRTSLLNLEETHGVEIIIQGDIKLQTPDFTLEKTGNPSRAKRPLEPKQEVEVAEEIADEFDDDDEMDELEDVAPSSEPKLKGEEDPVKKKRRRKRRRRKAGSPAEEIQTTDSPPETEEENSGNVHSGDPEREAVATLVPGLYLLSEATGETHAATQDSPEEGHPQEKTEESRPRRRRRRWPNRSRGKKSSEEHTESSESMSEGTSSPGNDGTVEPGVSTATDETYHRQASASNTLAEAQALPPSETSLPIGTDVQKKHARPQRDRQDEIAHSRVEVQDQPPHSVPDIQRNQPLPEVQDHQPQSVAHDLPSRHFASGQDLPNELKQTGHDVQNSHSSDED